MLRAPTEFSALTSSAPRQAWCLPHSVGSWGFCWLRLFFCGCSGWELSPLSWVCLKTKTNQQTKNPPQNWKETSKISRYTRKQLFQAPLFWAAFLVKCNMLPTKRALDCSNSKVWGSCSARGMCIRQMVWWEWLLLISQYSYICMYIYT